MSVMDSLKVFLTNAGYTDLALNDQIFDYLGGQGFMQDTLPGRLYGYGGWNSLIVDATTISLSPTDAFASALDYETIDVAWMYQASEDLIDGFEVERREHPSLTWTVISSSQLPSARTYQDVPLAPESLYSYRVRGYKVVGAVREYTEYSNEATESSGDLQVPSSVATTSSNYHTITITWIDNSGYETAYELYRTEAGGVEELISTVSPNTTSYVDYYALHSTSYSYRLRGVYGSYFSAYSPSSSIVTVAAPVGKANLQIDEFNNGIAGSTLLSLAASNDLSYMYVGLSGSEGVCAHSTDKGVTWTLATSYASSFGSYQLSCSASGQYVISSLFKYVSKSNDYGVTFVDSYSFVGNTYNALAMNSTGSLMMIASNVAMLYSTDFGVSWTSSTTSPALGDRPRKAAMSDNGVYSYVVGQVTTPVLARSVDSCVNFANVTVSALAGARTTSVSCNSTGQFVYATGYTPDYVYRLWKSSDYGATFTLLDPSASFDFGAFFVREIEVSDDGTHIVITGNNSETAGRRLAMSTDSGASFSLTTLLRVGGAYNTYSGLAIGPTNNYVIATPGSSGFSLRGSPASAF